MVASYCYLYGKLRNNKCFCVRENEYVFYQFCQIKQLVSRNIIKMKKIFFIGLTAAVLLITLNLCLAHKKEKQKPNILFIMSDDHTSQAWGIYGGILKNYVKNPNIDRLAKKGVVLNNCFCTNSICVPSRASILTGQYSHNNGVFTLYDGLNPDSMNIAKLLQDCGYQTGIIGKWHLKNKPLGFNYFNVLSGQGRYWNPLLKSEKNWNKGGEEYKGFSTDIITDLTIDWIENRDINKPFFMMCHFKATHAPFDYPKRYNEIYRDSIIPEPESLYDFSPETTGRSFIGRKIDILGDFWIHASNNLDKWPRAYPGLPFSMEGLDSVQARSNIYQKFIKDYMRSGAAIDDNIGRLLDYLNQSGLEDNTVIIYTSDQGYFLGEHGFIDKRMMYEESIRMPFVICYPKEIPAGKRVDDIILNIDFPSLFLDYAGTSNSDSMQGKSFRKNLIGHTPENWRKSMYYRYWAHQAVRPAHFGIRDERYKLIFFYGRGLQMQGNDNINIEPSWEFYDLKNDPNELQNAYNDHQYTEIIKIMKKELQAQREKVGDTDENYPEVKNVIEKYWN